MIRASVLFGPGPGARRANKEFASMAAFRKAVASAQADGFLEQEQSDHTILIPWHAVTSIEVRNVKKGADA